jgi:hypothetical protein
VINIFDTAIFNQSRTHLEHTSTNYFQITDFGFLRLVVSELHKETFYPTPDVKVPAARFKLGLDNANYGDFNGDGLLDLVFTPMVFPHVIPHLETSLAPIILLQDQNGSFKDPKVIDAASQLPNQHFLNRIATADFNQDGNMDFVISGMLLYKKENYITNYNTEDLPAVFLGSISDNFSASKNYGNLKSGSSGYASGHSITTGDYNGDGMPDFVSDFWVFTSERSSETKFLPKFLDYLNTADRSWYPRQNSVASADFNNDGFTDIVFSVMPMIDNGLVNGGDLHVMFGSSAGLRDGVDTVKLQRDNIYRDNVGTNFLVAFDANGDGNKDFLFLEHDWTYDNGNTATYYSNGRLRLYLGNGDGSFLEKTENIKDPFSGTRFGEGNIHILDVNGDGWEDIVLSGYASGKSSWTDFDLGLKTSIFLNKNGVFTLYDKEPLPYLSPYQIEGWEKSKQWKDAPPSKMVPVDLGNDGMIDFVGTVNVPILLSDNILGADAPEHTIAYIVRAKAPLGRDIVDETLNGTKNNDKIFGFDGNDVFIGGSGNDSFDGGLGLDTARYAFNRKDYIISNSSNGITVTDSNKSRDGVDKLTNIERIDFTDGDLIFDVTSANAPAAYRLYGGAFARTPDEGGFRFWASTLDKNVSLRDVATQFIGSGEFIGRYGASLSNAAFVDALYQNVLSRGGDAGGVAYWNKMLNDKLQDRSDVLVQFTQLPEFVGISAANITNGYWVV